MPTLFQSISGLLFAIAILHTFSTRFFEHLANTRTSHVGLWRLLGEVEVVFGFWAMVLMIIMFILHGSKATIHYMDSCRFTEPVFVFVIMVMAATRPILQMVMHGISGIARLIPLSGCTGFYFVILALIPLSGSFITEPAAMTLAALILAHAVFSQNVSSRLKYATVGVLFVNISIGGTLTTFAAPPILMVAAKWGWDTGFMLFHFGWKAVIAVLINAFLVTCLFHKELRALPAGSMENNSTPVPWALMLVHSIFLVSVVIFAHHAAIFTGLFLFFLGVTHAYSRYQSPLVLREGLLVAFFLGGLVVLGGQQQWWLQPLLIHMNSHLVFLGTAVLTSITDNATLTYLGSLIQGLPMHLEYALVAGAVTGGGLTIIANAPNPAGIAILREYFSEKTINPLGLFIAALPSTIIAGLAFKYLG